MDGHLGDSMAHGTPDWGHIGPKSTTYGLDDVAELAARLDSPVIFDRRGDVILLESWENGLSKCTFAGDGFGNLQELTMLSARHGGLSCMLTAGKDEGRSSYLYHYTFPPVASRFGLEASFGVVAATDYILFDILLYDGAAYKRGMLSLNHTEGVLKYVDSDGDFQDFATSLNYMTIQQPWNTLKFVVDFIENEYVRCILNDQNWDLRGTACRQDSADDEPHLETAVEHHGVADNNPAICVDRIIVTQNEP